MWWHYSWWAETRRRNAEQKAAIWFYGTVSEWLRSDGDGSSHLAWIDSCDSLAMSIVSSQLMSRLAPALLRCVLHLESVALLLMEAGEVGNRRRLLGGGVGRWAHSNSWRVCSVFGAENVCSAAGGCVV